MTSYIRWITDSQLRIDPQSYYFLHSEPLVFSSSDRESTAEIFFENFNAAGVLFKPAPLLALQAAGALTSPPSTPSGSHQPVSAVMPSFGSPVSTSTGVVVDVGESRTSVVPIVEGCVLGGAARSAAVGSRDALQVVQRALRERQEPVPSILVAACHVRARACYVCLDPIKEHRRWTEGPREKFFKSYRLSEFADSSLIAQDDEFEV
eukprot:CAMPEP_0175048188 /NCGR_PEP_ID=MMETSP0052_2-20121109/6034_1 /TAXON_ID=51329 ORGANISM="Polytomella parva, Strain SAG 63-3" /NCGR_SAMPLE_ID=MMETSP0052_2 /ASSEMBLY_ACC=CAM_ASM_000194 /LENGTH=206 /DNA_ID=CAMNT_0016312191 /DNA_START=141 /DNA_END=758 /DNA_ORIENTATION=-